MEVIIAAILPPQGRLHVLRGQCHGWQHQETEKVRYWLIWQNKITNECYQELITLVSQNTSTFGQCCGSIHARIGQ